MKSIVSVATLFLTTSLSMGADVVGADLLTPHVAFPRIDTLTQQAMMHERTCVFVLDANNNPVGTGFIVSQDVPEKGIYFVTARHVLEMARLFSAPKAKLRIRINSSYGTHGEIVNVHLALDGDRPWIEHKNQSVDLAVIPIGPVRFDRGFTPDPSLYSLMALDFSNRKDNNPISDRDVGRVKFANEKYRQLNGITAGSSVLTIGLVPFVNIHNVYEKTLRTDPSYEGNGNMPNLLVQKRGWIAAIPKTPLLITGLPGHPHGLANSIILDCQVVHGNSGSPVFVEVSQRNGLYHDKRYDLLGVVSSITPDISTPINWGSGLSSIVPVDYLCDILEYPETEQIHRDIQAIQRREKEASKERSEVKESFLRFINEHRNGLEVLQDSQEYKDILNRVQKVMEREKEIYGEYYKRYRTDIFDQPLDLLKNPKAYYDFD